MFAHLTVFARHHASRATALVFSTSGLTYGTWAAMIPFVKQKFGLDEAQLGVLLLSMPAGVLLANPLSVPMLHRFGAIRSALWTLAAAAVLFVLPLFASEIWLVGASLFAAGTAFSLANNAMNTCASLLEQRAGLRVMASCHGFWSAGAMLGAALAGVSVGLGAAPLAHVFGVAMLALAGLWLLAEPLGKVPEERRAAAASTEKKGEKRGFAMPNAALWSLIAISLCTNLMEGTMADWSAVYMKEVALAPEAMVGWGFSAYAFFMASGRFVGDGLLATFNSRTVLRGGGLLAAAGLALAVFLQNQPLFVLLGFACVGAGVSLGSPILYAASARVPGMAKGAGLATMNTFAMAGFLGGPVFIGFLAKAFSLPVAFGAVATTALFWAWKSRSLRD